MDYVNRTVSNFVRVKFGLRVEDYATSALFFNSFPADHGRYLPTLGELFYRSSYVSMLQHAISGNRRIFATFDDDAVLHEQTREFLRTEARPPDGCLSPLSTHDGIVLLGSSEWNNRWDAIDSQLSKGHCYDVHDRALGSFGVVFTKGAASRLIELSEEFPRRPLDLLSYELAKEGYYTRVVFPNIVIADHFHKSRVNAKRVRSNDEMDVRTKAHRWVLDDYLFERPSEN